MNEEAHARGARAPDALAESAPAGKQRLSPPGGERIGALVRAASALLPAAGRLVEVGYDRGAILLRVLAARTDISAIGIEILTAATLPDSERLAVRTGDGFDPLAIGEADVALLAGMGGPTIAEILARDPAKTRSFAALVLCPSHLEADIRPTLADLGFAPAAEQLVTERGRFYEIITARPLSDCLTSEHDRDPVTASWGPRLFDARDPLLVAFLEDARRRFHAAFAKDLRAYRSGPKSALGRKLAGLDRALQFAL